jgi:alpha 1,2-mannosyltransferase
MHGENIYMGKVASQKMTRNPEGGKVSAAIVVLARDDDIEDVLLSLGRMEKHFNHKYLYDYVFLNNNDFNYNFRDRSVILKPQSRTYYGPMDHYPCVFAKTTSLHFRRLD